MAPIASRTRAMSFTQGAVALTGDFLLRPGVDLGACSDGDLSIRGQWSGDGRALAI